MANKQLSHSHCDKVDACRRLLWMSGAGLHPGDCPLQLLKGKAHHLQDNLP